MADILEVQIPELLHEAVQELVLLEGEDVEHVLEVPTEQVLLDPAPEDVLLEPVETVVLLEAAQQGPPGPPGAPGQAGVSYVTFLASGPLGGHRAVRATFARHAQYSDNDDVAGAASVLGITLHAADAEAPVNVAASGEIVEPSWAWAVDAPIFVGGAGVLTQVPPTTGFQLVVGVATSPTSMLVSIKQPIIL